MRLIKEINLKTMSKKYIWAVAMFGCGLVFIFMGSYGSVLGQEVGYKSILYRLSILIIAVIIGTILHELLHGVFFKIFTGKVKFGVMFHKIMLVVPYATSQGSIIKRKHFVIIALAPQIMTMIVVILLMFQNNFSLMINTGLVMLGAFNLGGGCMDIYSVLLVLKEKGEVYTEDTITGMKIYNKLPL